MVFDKLKAEFPRDQVHWRAQSLTKAGDKALALAYIDARDVMDRFDAVCEPHGWQSEHYDCGGGRMGCKIGVYCVAGDKANFGEYGQWIWKSDGAGGTAVEADKGAFSDSFKRAAVQWGVGRYLYDLPANWIACKTYTGKDGKVRFKEFTEDPWDKTGAPRKEIDIDKWGTPEALNAFLQNEIMAAANDAEAVGNWKLYRAEINLLKKTSPEEHASLRDWFARFRHKLPGYEA